MILISLLIVLAIEFHFKLASEYRDYSWFEKFRGFIADSFADKGFFDSWLGIAIILLTPILILYGLVNIFNGPFYWLVLFIVSVALLFLSIGPKPLEKEFEKYFDSMDRGDSEAAYLHWYSINNGKEEVRLPDEQVVEVGSNQAEIPEEDELVRSATRTLLVEAEKRYFGVIAWFILIGPLGALFYRLSYLYRDYCASNEFDEHLPLMELLIHWIDWVPARITSLFFLLTGDFVKGFYRIQDYLTDPDADNNQLLSETGVAALGLEMGVSDNDVEENTRTMDMIKRTLIIYLVLAAIVNVVL
jgi:AmpE protein